MGILETLKVIKDRRAQCERCLRPPKVCVCSVLPPPKEMPIKIRTRILILQHPRESKKKTIGTVPLIKLVLGQGCEVIVSPTNGKRNSGRYFNHHPKVLEAALSGKSLVLFPALHPQDADSQKMFFSPVMNLEDRTHESVWGPDGGTLIVIDGSWSQAKVIFKHAPILHSVPRVQFSTEGLGEYGQLRCEPQETFMSTLESVAHALEILEGSAPGASTGCRAKEALIAVQRELVRHQKSKIPPASPSVEDSYPAGPQHATIESEKAGAHAHATNPPIMDPPTISKGSASVQSNTEAWKAASLMMIGLALSWLLKRKVL